MSKKESQVSDKAQDAVQPVSVLDFLYHDARRVGSFLAQFDPSGHLTGLKQSENTSSQEGEEGTLQAGANAIGLRAVGTHITKRANGQFENSERIYDPLWTNARTFLDYLTEHDLLVRDIHKAHLGQFVITKGRLILLDLNSLKGAWDIPVIKKFVQQGIQLANNVNQNRNDRRAADAKGNSDTDAFLALLKLLPHSAQARLIGVNSDVWCSLDDAAIVGRPSDLMLKHGVLLDGEWSIVGILDALPDDPNPTAANGEPLDQLLASLISSAAGQMMAALGPFARKVLGRPHDTYGMTPLLIYRVVSS